MSLPKIEHPTFTLEVPSTKKKVVFRPFLVKEEKMLLMAKVSNKESDMLLAIKQIVNNCAVDEDFDIDDLTLVDMEYLYIKLRANSVSDVIEVSYRDLEDEKQYSFSINLNDVKVLMPEKPNNVVKINDTTGFTLRYPRAALYEDEQFLSSGSDTFFQLIIRCIDKIYYGDEVYNAKDYTIKDLEKFFEDLSVSVFDQVRDFMIDQPSLSYIIKYKNSLGNDREIELRTLTDFFSLR